LVSGGRRCGYQLHNFEAKTLRQILANLAYYFQINFSISKNKIVNSVSKNTRPDDDASNEAERSGDKPGS
jgi:hypothetical protein